LPQYFEPVQNGQHDIQQYQVEAPLDSSRQAASAIENRFQRKAGPGQNIGDQLAETGVIIHE
jgi:hypothetical protein